MSFGIPIKVGIRLRICQWHRAPQGSMEEEETIHSDSSRGWVSQGSAVGGHKGTWLTTPPLCALQDANCLQKLILPAWFVQWVISRKELLYFLEWLLWNSFSLFFFFFLIQWASFQLVIYQQSILQDHSLSLILKKKNTPCAIGKVKASRFPSDEGITERAGSWNSSSIGTRWWFPVHLLQESLCDVSRWY